MARASLHYHPVRRAVAVRSSEPTADLGAFRVPEVARRAHVARTTPPNATEMPQRKAWQATALAEITNFTALRRRLGLALAGRLVFDLERRLRATLPQAAIAIAGRTTLEFRHEAATETELRDAVEVFAAACRAPFELGGEGHAIDVAIGIAIAPVGMTEEVRMIEEAESALHEARPYDDVVVRNLSIGVRAFDRLTLTRELPVAIARGEMFLHYQPKVHVRRQEINSAEALIRWQHPTRGLILPGDFITVVEDARQIATLTLWTLDRVIADQALLAKDGRDLTIFINISGQLLGDPRFVEAACARVREAGVRIGFEITETAVIRDPGSAIANLHAFADVGITIAIDDYGAGLSSLAYLKQLPARELKIDKMFVLQLTSSNRDPLIVRSTIDLAHALDMEVTAEGVETEAALALLSVMGCDMVQGYLISRPVSIDAFRKFLRDEPLMRVDPVRDTMFKRPATFWKSACA